MKEKRTLIFKSWENALDKDTRAIALCDKDNYFGIAINCLRDPDIQGSKNRFWASDYVLEEEKQSLRYASDDEVELYMETVKIKDVLDSYCGKNYEAKVTFCGFYKTYYLIDIEITDCPWYKKLYNFFKH